MTAEESAAGYRGWYASGPLPHCDRRGLKQLITYRLADALPASVRTASHGIRAADPEDQKWHKLQACVDNGAGECLLADPVLAGVVDENLRHLDGRMYRLIAWVVMPNHLHALIETDLAPLAKIVRSWKGFTARRINQHLGRMGAVWERNFFDTYIRSERHLVNAIRYVDRNPVRAGLVRNARDWPFGSARFAGAGGGA